MTCSIDDCEAQVEARGWCGKHYARWRRRGNPVSTAIRPHGLSLEDAFRWHMPGAIPSEGCWEWNSGGNGKGYGQMEFGGKCLSAHVVAYRVFVGELEDEQVVRHSCDNPICVNPQHLLLGTSDDNRQDCVRRGRQARGERQHSAKLTESDVCEIRNLYVAGTPQEELSRRFGVVQSTISSVVRRESWAHVGSD